MLYKRQSSKPSQKEKKFRKAKWFSEEALQIAEKKRSKKQRRKGKIYSFECRVLKSSKERYKSLLQE